MKKRSFFPVFYLVIVTLFTFVPIVVTIVYSFNASKLTSVWGGFSLAWYRRLFADTDIFRALKNSLILGALCCLASAVIGTLGAIGMKKTAYKLNGIISYLSTLPIMIPEIILGMVYLALFSFMNIPFGMLTLVIAHTSFCIPYVFMMVSDRLVGMDPATEEAARDLGAGPVRIFFDITLPEILPGILSGVLLSFAMSIDDVVISIFVTGSTVNTLPIKIYTRLKTGITPEINALATLMIGATVVILALTRLAGRKKK
ncbi:MAG: ABC transporter permease [Lachnospiraceae bacterium]|nr:ABC transporter permease [Lachnospiraceae bacterium]